jgi:hypothetical protein
VILGERILKHVKGNCRGLLLGGTPSFVPRDKPGAPESGPLSQNYQAQNLDFFYKSSDFFK